jgi:hypothetical protein
LTDQNVEIAFLRVEATVGTNAHIIFGEDHKCSINKRSMVLAMKKLRGENRIERFKQVAERLASKSPLMRVLLALFLLAVWLGVLLTDFQI